jgi:hypothetical protein
MMPSPAGQEVFNFNMHGTQLRMASCLRFQVSQYTFVFGYLLVVQTIGTIRHETPEERVSLGNLHSRTAKAFGANKQQQLVELFFTAHIKKKD